MSNPFNYTLTDFFDTNIPAVYGQDYYVDYKSLRFQLSSTYYQQLTALTSNNKGLCALDLENLPNLSSVSIREPNLIQFNSSTRLTYISAENINVPNLVLSGGRLTYFGIFFSPALESIDLTGIESVGNFVTLFNNYQLSEINWGNSLNIVPTFISLSDNNLSNETIDTLYTSICAVSGNTSLAGKFISISNPNSGTETGYQALTALQDEGATINVTVISPTPTPTPTNTPTITPSLTLTPTASRTPTPSPRPPIGFIIWIANETPSAYGTNNNCAVKIRPISPTARTFNISSDLGSSTVATNSDATINGGRSSVWNAGLAKTITIQDAGDPSVSTSVVVTPGYNTANASMVVTPAGSSSSTYSNIPGSISFSNQIVFANNTFGSLGLVVWVANETPSAYGTNNDCAVKIMPIAPSSRTFNVSCDLGATTVITNSDITFNGGRAAVWNAGESKLITIQDTVIPSISGTITVVPGYNTATASVTIATAEGASAAFSNIPGATNFVTPVTFSNNQFVTSTPTPTPTVTPTLPTPTPSISPTLTPTKTPTPTHPPFLNMTITVANETPSAYGTNNDCAVQITPNSPPFKTFNIYNENFGASSVATGSTAGFNVARANGAWASGTTRTFTISATDDSVAATLTIIPGYDTGTTSVSATLRYGTPVLSSFAGVSTLTKSLVFSNNSFA